MAEPRVRITKRLIETIVPDGKEQVLRDTEVLGFGLRISTGGQLTYICAIGSMASSAGTRSVFMARPGPRKPLGRNLKYC